MFDGIMWLLILAIAFLFVFVLVEDVHHKINFMSKQKKRRKDDYNE